MSVSRTGIASAVTSATAGVPRPWFGYFQPEAREVFLVGDFNEWQPRAAPMTRDGLGDWSMELALPRSEYRYRLRVDGEWRDDPTAQQTVLNPFGSFDALVVI